MPEIPEPTPESPSAYPVHRVLGIVDQPATVESVVTGLADAGVPAASVKVVCGAPAADAEQAQELGTVMKEHGGHFVNYYGPSTITTIAP